LTLEETSEGLCLKHDVVFEKWIGWLHMTHNSWISNLIDDNLIRYGP
jgi:hypothetical protein